MTIIEMLEQSGIMTIFGMGIVFSFLVVLVAAISLSGKIIGKIVKTKTVAASGNLPANNANVTAAISAAVNEYKQNK
ncbi:MAG: OadG family protein [Treponema sp.]|jgi:oxaloacetate decarboxylase gamma subunit|nr:OadG family protein [Treponema sp.]